MSFFISSNVYGSSIKAANNLRTFSGGLLKATPHGNSHLLPGDRNSPGCQAQSAQRMCFLAGMFLWNVLSQVNYLHFVRAW